MLPTYQQAAQRPCARRLGRGRLRLVNSGGDTTSPTSPLAWGGWGGLETETWTSTSERCSSSEPYAAHTPAERTQSGSTLMTHGAGRTGARAFGPSIMNRYPEECLAPTLDSLVAKGILEREPEPDGAPDRGASEGTPQGRVRVTETGEGVYRTEVPVDWKQARRAARKAPEGWHRSSRG